MPSCPFDSRVRLRSDRPPVPVLEAEGATRVLAAEFDFDLPDELIAQQPAERASNRD